MSNKPLTKRRQTKRIKKPYKKITGGGGCREEIIIQCGPTCWMVTVLAMVVNSGLIDVLKVSDPDVYSYIHNILPQSVHGRGTLLKCDPWIGEKCILIPEIVEDIYIFSLWNGCKPGDRSPSFRWV